MTVISVVIPIYNCSDCLGTLHKRLLLSLNKITKNYEIILINDGSKDNSWKIIEEIVKNNKKTKAINFSRNFGQQIAIAAGLDFVQGKWAIVMDGDLQDQPEEIINFYNKALQGFDIVVGKRERRKHNLLKKLTSRLFYDAFSFLSGIKVDPKVGNFSIISSKVVENLRQFKESNTSYAQNLNWIGFRKSSISVTHAKRYAGKSSYSFFKLFSYAIDSIIAYSNKPLKISILIGFLISSISFIYGMFIIIKYMLFGIPVTGYSSIIVSIYFLSGLILSNLGIFGLYISKIYDQSKKRPSYVIGEKIGEFAQ